MNKMMPTQNIPIALDPKELKLEADEARLIRIAEIRDQMFCNRLLHGMGKRQEERLPSSSSSPDKNEIEVSETQQVSFLMENLPLTLHSQLMSIVMTSPAIHSAPRRRAPSPVYGEDEVLTALLSSDSSLMTASSVHADGANEELMFDLDF